ncbi:MAG: 50S ribosomal protein L1 [DPANN group archaeon]|nr:50S ribosomal protein L1 [DPANN group archaeon]
MKLAQAIQEIKDKSKQRKFNQSVDLIINFRTVDFNKPDNRLKLELKLPKGRGKKKRVAVITKTMVDAAKKAADVVITDAELSDLGQDKKKVKQITSKIDFFLAEADPAIMGLVAKNLGQVLGPKGKMPKPVPPRSPIENIIKGLQETITIKNKGKFLPTVHTPVGTEDMPNQDLEENIRFVYSKVIASLPNQEGNIKSMFIKTTMGPVIKVEMK